MVRSCTKKVHKSMVRNTNRLEVTGISRGRERPEKIWIETIKNDFRALYLTDKVFLGRTKWNFRFM